MRDGVRIEQGSRGQGLRKAVIQKESGAGGGAQGKLQ